MEITDFEDKGAHWEVRLESVRGYQFPRHSRRANRELATEYEEAIQRVSNPLLIPIDPALQSATEARKPLLESEASVWLDAHCTFLGLDVDVASPPREGPRSLRGALNKYMKTHELSDVEREFALHHMRNPNWGELVKGHRIILAELGLVAFDGCDVRNPD